MSHLKLRRYASGVSVAVQAVSVFGFVVLAACSDGVTGPGGGGLLPTGPDYLDSFQLETLEVTSCQYGGTYPNCQSAPSSGGTTTAQPNGGAPGGGSGGTTGSTTGSEPTPTCDPQSDPKCELPLSDVDKRVIQSVVGKYRRSDSAFTDPQARDLCNRMADKFSEMFAAGLVFRGATDTHDGDPNISPHRGAYDPNTGHIHFDPSYLDLAAGGDMYWERDLANDALHEAAHALGFDHGDSTNSPWGPIYGESPFNLLSPGGNSCLNWN